MADIKNSINMQAVNNDDGSIAAERAALEETYKIQENFEARFQALKIENSNKLDELNKYFIESSFKTTKNNKQTLFEIDKKNELLLKAIKEQSDLAAEEHVKQNNELREKLLKQYVKNESTYKNELWVAEEKHIKQITELANIRNNSDSLKDEILTAEALTKLVTSSSKEAKEYQNAVKENNKLVQESKLAKSEKNVADIEFELKSKYDSILWKNREIKLRQQLAIEEEATKAKNLADAAVQNDANKALLSNVEYQERHAENIKKELENALEANKNALAQAQIDNKTKYDVETSPKYAEAKKTQDLESRHEEILQKVREKNAASVIATKQKFEDKIQKAQEKGDTEKVKKLEAQEKKKNENAEKRAKAEADVALAQENGAKALSALNDSNLSLVDRLSNAKAAISNADGSIDMAAAVSAIGDYVASLNESIETIAGYKSSIDTRLQGSTTNTSSTGKAALGAAVSLLTGGLVNFGSTSYWDNISKQITGAAGVSPFVKQADIASNVKELVEKGINTNVAQRAFVETIKDKVAATFDATNGTLLRLVRIQQQDSTAARLGMESMITQFLNNMYENTEYLEGVSTSVKDSLNNAMSLMSAENAISFEYQVQKWLGSFYSVGVSQESVQSIATSLGKISSGDITGITGNNSGNLLVMAANQAGLSIADILAKGLDDSSTNQLMQAMSGYLYELLKNSSDNLVVQQQIAEVYGMSAADLKAIANLYTDSGKTIKNIAKSTSDYGESMARLNSMLDSIALRSTVGEMMSNAFENLQYTISAGIANNPVLYATYKIAGMLDDVVGGIPIPMVSVMGNTVDLHTTVADLMQVAALSGSLLSGIGQMIATGGGGGITPGLLAKGFGITETSGMTSVSRGGGIGGNGTTVKKGSSVSESGYAGNASSGDVKTKTMSDATADSKSQLAGATEESNEKTNTDLFNKVDEIVTLIKAITSGSSALHVRVDDYGLTGFN